MDLIDFNEEVCEGGKKLSSPLIPVPNVSPKLSDTESNPFDKVLRTLSNKNDPFEVVENSSFKNKKIVKVDESDKENVGYLISPIHTPTRSKKYKKFTLSPLYITDKQKDDSFDNNLLTTSFTYKLQNSSMCCNMDNSLQILNDSVFNNDSFNLALNIPLPSDSPDDEYLQSNDNCLPVINQELSNIPTVKLNDGVSEQISNQTASDNNIMNNAFIENSRKLTAVSSITNMNTPVSFHAASLGKSEISSIYPSISSTNSNIKTENPLNLGFINDLTNRKCMSARKPDIHQSFICDLSKPRNLNNSYGGFRSADAHYNFSDHYNDDSVFLEASHLAEIFRTNAPLEIEDEIIINCTPPWLEEKICFADSDEDSIEVKKEENIVSEVIEQDKTELQVKEEIVDKCTDNIECSKTESVDDSDVQNAKDLLHNLSKIINKSGDVVDQKTLGENLLNSLALALNIDTPIANNQSAEKKSFNKLQRSKSDSKVNEKSRRSSLVTDKKITLPKLKLQPAAPVNLDKNLKPKIEKEKAKSKGPLKALIPFNNVTKPDQKNKIVSAIKPFSSVVTPIKNSTSSAQFQIKKTSTPNEIKIKSPIAQSTPDMNYKKSSNDSNRTTPISKRHFGFSISPLVRPASTNDINNCSVNKSLSPKHQSGSVPNISSNLNKSGSVAKSSNTSIPTITRRNSASEINSSRTSLNRSYENNKPARPTQLKRSSSFQNKANTNFTPQISSNKNNIVLKKYGAPGKIKPLKLSS